jgi:hypothetical protein
LYITKFDFTCFLDCFQLFYADMDGGAPSFSKISGFISSNVSAVTDGLDGTIKKPVGFRAAQMWVRKAWEWSVPQRSWGPQLR